MKKDNKYILISFIIGIFFLPAWIITLYFVLKKIRERGINYKIIRNNILIVLISLLIAISPLILQITSIYWDPRFAQSGSGAPLIYLIFYTVPIGIIFMCISLLVYNLFCCLKSKG